MAKALIIIDMQKGFFAEESLRTRQDDLVRASNQLIRAAQAADELIVGVRTVHSPDRSTWTLSMLDDDQGFMLEGDADTEYVDGLDLDHAHEVIKTRDSAFWQTDLLTFLRQRSIDHVVLAGVSTHLCIMQTAIDAYNANLGVTLATDAMASCRPSLHQPTVDLLQQEYRAECATNEILCSAGRVT